jgi:hypothetical protein
LSIVDCFPEARKFFNRKSAISNRKSPGSFLASFPRPSRKGTAFTLAQLRSGAAALERLFIRTETGAPVNRENPLHFRVRTRNYVNTNQLADSPRGCCSGIRCGFNRAYISTDKNRYIPGADVLFSQECDVCCFDHRVGSFHCANEAFGLNHSECF